MTATTLDPQDTPDLQPDPRKPRHRVRRVLLITGGAFAALVLIATITGAVSGSKTAAPAPARSSSAPPPVITQGPPAGVAAPKVTAAPAPKVTRAAAPAAPATTPPPAPAAPVVTAMGTWCAGTGWTDLQAVEADNTTMGDDATALDPGATEQDGTVLAAAAETATLNPPPVTSTQKLDYGLGMSWMMAAGDDAANGYFDNATGDLDKANGYFADDKGILSCP